MFLLPASTQQRFMHSVVFVGVCVAFRLTGACRTLFVSDLSYSFSFRDGTMNNMSSRGMMVKLLNNLEHYVISTIRLLSYVSTVI